MRERAASCPTGQSGCPCILVIVSLIFGQEEPPITRRRPTEAWRAKEVLFGHAKEVLFGCFKQCKMCIMCMCERERVADLSGQGCFP